MITMKSNGLPSRMPVFALAGLVGGMAEVVWIAFYGNAAQASVADVSRGVVHTLFPSAAASAFAPANGLMIHMALSFMLAIVFGLAIWQPLLQRASLTMNLLAGAAILLAIWTVNFFVVLPAMNPSFVTLLPYSVTFVSKLLFGLSMGMLLYHFGDRADTATVVVRSNRRGE